MWLKGKNLCTTHPSVKLRPKRFGPFEVTEVVSPTTYRLNLPLGWQVHNTFHGGLLTRYNETKEYGKNYPEPPLEMIEGGEEYEVEEILDSRRKGRTRNLEYLVKWKGWSSAHNSWEPKKNVHAPELVEKFYKAKPTAIKAAWLGRGLTSNMPSVMENVSPIYSPVPSLQYPEPQSWLSPLGGLFTDSPEPIHTLTSFPPYPPSPEPDPRLPSPASTAEVDKLLPDSLTPEEPPAQSVPIEGQQHPGPPWYRWTDMPGHPPFVVRVGEQEVVMPFLRFKDINGKPHQLRTEGAGSTIHGRPILAGPMEGDRSDHDEDLEMLVSKPTYNFAAAQALDYLDDPGVLAKVARFRNYAIQLPVMLDRSRMFHNLVTAFGAFQERFNNENQAFLNRMEQCWERFVAGQVRARVNRAMMQLHQRGELGG